MLNSIKKNQITQTVMNHLCENWKIYVTFLATAICIGLGWKIDRSKLVKENAILNEALNIAKSPSAQAAALNVLSQSARGVGIFAKS